MKPPLPMMLAMADALGLPSEPIVRHYDRGEPLPYGQRHPPTISGRERAARKAKKKAAKLSKRRNRR